MIDYYICFPDKITAELLLADLPATANVDLVGVLYSNDVYHLQPEELADAAAVPGYHVNIRMKEVLPDSLVTYVVTPVTPTRRFWDA